MFQTTGQLKQLTCQPWLLTVSQLGLPIEGTELSTNELAGVGHFHKRFRSFLQSLVLHPD